MMKSLHLGASLAPRLEQAASQIHCFRALFSSGRAVEALAGIDKVGRGDGGEWNRETGVANLCQWQSREKDWLYFPSRSGKIKGKAFLIACQGAAL